MPVKGNTTPLALRFWSKVNKSGNCWLWTGSTSGGYGTIGIDYRSKRAHRVSYELAYGPVPEGYEVCHHCDTPLCVRPDHLFAATHFDNMADMVAKGRSGSGDRSGARLHPDKILRGERRPSAKLTGAIIREIRMLRADGMTTTALAAQFGVSVPTICDIVNGKKWRHVP